MYRLLFLLIGWELLGSGRAVAQADQAPTVTATEAAAAGAPPLAPVYHTAEVMPQFPGGAGAFGKFLQQKLQYPAEALGRGVSGKVYVQFVVDERGHIIDPQVVKGLGYGLDQEALRLVRIMPWWTPGLIAGRPVKVSYTLPIIFRAL
ncbi:energy transducer TonB [Hymenobacter sp. B81]|uniref:energy transducer TonB n=1 Tax=Hymenobacter sp. B81 TaxID=3344878 RepID=UPI0037DCA637